MALCRMMKRQHHRLLSLCHFGHGGCTRLTHHACLRCKQPCKLQWRKPPAVHTGTVSPQKLRVPELQVVRNTVLSIITATWQPSTQQKLLTRQQSDKRLQTTQQLLATAQWTPQQAIIQQ